jgi:hypothetical protein
MERRSCGMLTVRIDGRSFPAVSPVVMRIPFDGLSERLW